MACIQTISIKATRSSYVQYYINDCLVRLGVKFHNAFSEANGLEINIDYLFNDYLDETKIKIVQKIFETAREYYKMDVIFHSSHPDLDVSCYWSKVHDINNSAQFFEGCKNVLDIGSGIGKFVLLASVFNKETNFTGVEVNPKFFNAALEIQKRYPGKNNFINTDFCNIDMSQYDGAYIFNPFCMSHEYQNSGKSKDHFIDSLNRMPNGSKLLMNINIFDIKHTDFKYIKRMGSLYFFTKVK